MGRPPRADEAGKICHALNRGNARNKIFFITNKMVPDTFIPPLFHTLDVRTGKSKRACEESCRPFLKLRGIHDGAK